MKELIRFIGMTPAFLLIPALAMWCSMVIHQKRGLTVPEWVTNTTLGLTLYVVSIPVIKILVQFIVNPAFFIQGFFTVLSALVLVIAVMVLVVILSMLISSLIEKIGG